MEKRPWMKHHVESPTYKHNAVANVIWVPIEKVEANSYNPNSVATNEMKLLYLSIKADTYTQPIVTFYNDQKDMFEIIDGFHRYTTMKINADLREMNGGLLPIVVVDKPIEERMASTVRHNRARGKHSVNGMSNMVFEMLQGGMSDEEICNNLGMEADELIRLKHITGFAKLFSKAEYSQAYMTNNQVKIKKEYENANSNETDI